MHGLKEIKTTNLTQIEVEYKYSRKHVQNVILCEIDRTTVSFFKMTVAIRDYIYNPDYTYIAKINNVQHLQNHKLSIEEIALEILIAVLPLSNIESIQKPAARLASILGYEDEVAGISVALSLLTVTEGDYFDIYAHDHEYNLTGTIGIMSNVRLSESAIQELEIAQYLPPMLETPEDWTDNSHGGYQTVNTSAISGKFNHHNNPIGLDVLNILQHIGYVLNRDIVKRQEVPKAQPKSPLAKRMFRELKRKSRYWYRFFGKNVFYFVWRFDKRGRIYSSGYHINPQSFEYKKALIDFAKTQIIEIK